MATETQKHEIETIAVSILSLPGLSQSHVLWAGIFTGFYRFGSNYFGKNRNKPWGNIVRSREKSVGYSEIEKQRCGEWIEEICFSRPRAPLFFALHRVPRSVPFAAKTIYMEYEAPPLAWRGTATHKASHKNELLPLYAINENGEHYSAWAFTDIDAAPTKSYIIENPQDETAKTYFDWYVKRPEYELPNVRNDSCSLNNLLAGNPEFAAVNQELKQGVAC